MVERSVRDREVVGSNPAIPTIELSGGPCKRPAVPVHMKGLVVVEELLRWTGYGLCHQLPERSFFGGGIQVPVCARDTGIYVGFIVSLIALAILHRGERPRRFAPTAAWVAMGAMLVVFGWDGVSSYAGFRGTTNEIRLATGLGVGFSSAALLAPILNDLLWRTASDLRVLAPTWRLGAWLASIIATWVVVWYALPLLGRGYPVVVSLAILVTLAVINLVMVAMHPAFDRQAGSIRDLALPMILSLVLAGMEIWLAALARGALVGWLS